MFHYAATSIQGPYHSLGYVDLGYGQGSGVWAPFILRAGKRTLMFYTARNQQREMSLRVAESTDPHLRSWTRAADGDEIIVNGHHVRDPQIIRDPRTGAYILYYIAATQEETTRQDVVWCKTSSDLVSWTEPRLLLGVPPGYGAAESVFVLYRNGFYYMWVSGHDHSRMSLYISADPFSFGDAAKNRIEEQPGHASEIVRVGRTYWMACVAIASIPALPSGPGLPISQHDLEGVYIQQLRWRSATPRMMDKVTEHSTKYERPEQPNVWT